MSSADIDRLVQERSLIRELLDDDQVAGYWAKALASFTSAQAEGLSSDNAYQVAYTAGLQATLAVLSAHGLRVRSAANHYTAFHAAEKLDPDIRHQVRTLDALRMARHQSIYEPDHDEKEMTMRLGRALHALKAALPPMRAAILSVRPGLKDRLAKIEA